MKLADEATCFFAVIGSFEINAMERRYPKMHQTTTLGRDHGVVPTDHSNVIADFPAATAAAVAEFCSSVTEGFG